MTDRSPVPYRFDPDATASGLKQKYGHLEPGIETGDRAVVAGRLHARRGQGKLAFGQLADSTGRVRMFAPADETERFDEFTKLSLGDWISIAARS